MQRPLTIVLGILAAVVLGVGVYLIFGGQEQPTVTEVPVKSLSSGKRERPKPAPERNRPVPSSTQDRPSQPARTTPPPAPEPKPLPAVEGPVEIRGLLKDAQGGIGGVRLVLVETAAPSKLLAETNSASDGEGSEEGTFTFSIRTTARELAVAVMNDGWAVTHTGPFKVDGTGEPIELTLIGANPSTLQANVRFMAASIENLGQTSPLGGATISLSGDPLTSGLINMHSELLGLQTQSMVDGNLRLAGIPPGNHTFVAFKQGYAAPPATSVGRASVSYTASDNGDDLSGTFTLMQAGVLKGRVVAETTGLPVVGATVSVGMAMTDTRVSTVTNSDGIFIFDPIAATAVPTTTTNTQQPEGNRRRDAIWSTLGDRLLGYQIKAVSVGVGLAESDGHTVKVGETTDVGDVPLKQGAAIYGIVTNESGQPIAGATVSLHQTGGRAMGFNMGDLGRVAGISRPGSFYSVTTDEEGRYRIDPVPTAPPAEETEESGGRRFGFGGARNAEVSGTADGYSPAVQQARDLRPGEAREINLVLPLAGTITGRVIDEVGRPISGAKVAALDGFIAGNRMLTSLFGQQDQLLGGLFSSNVFSDAEGSFTIPNVTAGTYTVIASHEKFNQATVEGIELTKGATQDVTITMESGGTLFGTYYDETDRPKGGVTIQAIMTGFPPTIRSTNTDDSGNYEFNGLEAGVYSVKAAKGGADPMAMFRSFAEFSPNERAKVTDGGRTEHDVYENVPGTTTLRGRVLLDRAPYQGPVYLGGGGLSGISGKSITCDENGNFEARNLQLGTYTMFLGDPLSGGFGGRGRNAFKPLQSVEIVLSRRPVQDEVIEFTTVTIRGTVVMADGSLLTPDTVVFANPVERRDERGRSSAWDQVQSQFTEQQRPNRETGEFEITGLSPGLYYLTARSSQGGYVRLGPLNLTESVAGLRLTLDGGTGSIYAVVENYVAPTETGGFMAGGLGSFGSIQLQDLEGNIITLGSLGGGRGQPDNVIRLNPNPDTGVVDFTREGFPVGTWDVVFQVSNYAPVRQNGVVISRDQTTNLRLVLAKAGDLEVQISNSDLGPEAAQNLRYDIRDSRNQRYDKRFSFGDLMVNLLNPPDPSKKNTFILKDFPPDTYTATFELPGYRPATATFTIYPSQTTPIVVTFLPE